MCELPAPSQSSAPETGNALAASFFRTPDAEAGLSGADTCSAGRVRRFPGDRTRHVLALTSSRGLRTEGMPRGDWGELPLTTKTIIFVGSCSKVLCRIDREPTKIMVFVVLVNCLFVA